MGSLSVLSILKGPQRLLSDACDPIALHRIFENTVSTLEKINRSNTNNNNEVRTIHSIDIQESVAQQIALLSSDAAISFSQLNRSANQVARALLKRFEKSVPSGNSDGDFLVAVCMKPSEALVTTLLAIWKAGAAYLPLDVAFPKNRIHHILNESEPILTIVDDFALDNFNVVKYSELKEASLNLSETNIPEEITLSKGISERKRLAAVLYTSGSTGVPKGVRIPHAAILNRLKWQWKTFPYSPTEKVCVFKTALTFVDSVSELWGPLLNARSILILSKEDTKNPEKLTALLDKFKVERLILVPTLLQTILLYATIRKSGPFLSSLRLWVCSGEALSVSLAKQFYQQFDRKAHILCNFYGSTEIMGDVTYHVIENAEELETKEKIPIGVPLDNCTVYVLDENLRPVNVNDIGELYVSGLNLADGYVKKRDKNKFLDNPLAVDPEHAKLYKTGDFAKIVKNIVYYEGRTDSQIKVRGHRVDLSEIESALAKIDLVDKHVVLTYKPGEVSQAVLAFVTVTSPTTSREIEESLAMGLAPYMLPQVIILDHFPLLVNGKVDRQYLLQAYGNKFSSETEGESRTTEGSAVSYAGIPNEKVKKAKVLFETVASVLGKALRTRISANSNFYTLGGNSLNSVFTVTKLRDSGYAISISEFISSPTLLDVINKMDEENTSSSCFSSSPTLDYEVRLFAEEHREQVFEIITSSFYEKADLERHLEPPVPLSDYFELMNALWPHLVDKNLSFVVIGSGGIVKGAALNFDAHDEPDMSISPDNRLNVVFEFLEFLEGPLREEKLPKGKNRILHSFMMGSRKDLTPRETIEIFLFMEEEILKLAKARKFAGVFTSNTNALTQQLGCDVNNYESLLDYQVNKYVASDGSRPFANAPDSQRTIVSWKTVAHSDEGR